jgi:hypothetical protein
MKNPGYIWQKKKEKNFIPKGKSSSQKFLEKEYTRGILIEINFDIKTRSEARQFFNKINKFGYESESCIPKKLLSKVFYSRIEKKYTGSFPWVNALNALQPVNMSIVVIKNKISIFLPGYYNNTEDSTLCIEGKNGRPLILPITKISTIYCKMCSDTSKLSDPRDLIASKLIDFCGNSKYVYGILERLL